MFGVHLMAKLSEKQDIRVRPPLYVHTAFMVAHLTIFIHADYKVGRESTLQGPDVSCSTFGAL